MNATMRFLPLGALGFVFAGCSGQDIRDMSAESCGPLKKENIKLVTITGNKPNEPTVSPDPVRIKAGGLIVVRYVGDLTKGKNIRMDWDRKKPIKGSGGSGTPVDKNGDWMDKDNKRRNSIRVINVPCEAGDQTGDGDPITYKYEIAVRGGEDLDPRIIVEPPLRIEHLAIETDPDESTDVSK